MFNVKTKVWKTSPAWYKLPEKINRQLHLKHYLRWPDLYHFLMLYPSWANPIWVLFHWLFTNSLPLKWYSSKMMVINLFLRKKTFLEKRKYNLFGIFGQISVKNRWNGRLAMRTHGKCGFFIFSVTAVTNESHLLENWV